jgi:hypothetical protein
MPNGATTMNAQPPGLVVAAGAELPTPLGLAVSPLCEGTAAGDPIVLKLGTALDEKTGLEGAAGGGAGAFIDETWDECETCETWLPEPDT